MNDTRPTKRQWFTQVFDNLKDEVNRIKEGVQEDDLPTTMIICMSLSDRKASRIVEVMSRNQMPRAWEWPKGFFCDKVDTQGMISMIDIFVPGLSGGIPEVPEGEILVMVFDHGNAEFFTA